MKKIVLLLLCAFKPLCSAYVPQYVLNMFAKKTIANDPVKPQVRLISITDQTDHKLFIKELTVAAKNPEIAGIILVIDNGGGSSAAFSVLHDVIRKVASIKPVVGLVEGVACSGGYMVASATDFIIAHSMSSIGNIGVVWEIVKLKNPKQKKDVEADMEVEMFTAGEFKGYAFEYTKNLSEKERNYAQSYIDGIYKKFLDLVAKDRNLDLACSKEWAEGIVFLGEEALSLGLIDAIGTIFEAEKKILELIKFKNPTVLYADDISLIE